MNDTERPVIINGVPVYDTDNYVPGQKISKTKRKNAIKSITNIPKNIGKITSAETLSTNYESQAVNGEIDYDYEENNYKPSPIIKTSNSQSATGRKYGTISMVCGIISLFGIESIIFSIIFGITAIKLAKQTTDPKEMSYAKIGRITGILAIALSILILILTIVAGSYQELLP